MTKEDQELYDKYDSLWYGHPDFFKWWRVCRLKEYEDNKANDRPDTFDIFDDYKGPIIKK